MDRKPVRSTSGIGPRSQAIALLVQGRQNAFLAGQHGDWPLRSADDAYRTLNRAIAYLNNPANEGVA